MTISIPAPLLILAAIWIIIGAAIGFMEGRDDASRIIAGPKWDAYLQQIPLHIAIAPLSLFGLIRYAVKWRSLPWRIRRKREEEQ